MARAAFALPHMYNLSYDCSPNDLTHSEEALFDFVAEHSQLGSLPQASLSQSHWGHSTTIARRLVA